MLKRSRMPAMQLVSFLPYAFRDSSVNRDKYSRVSSRFSTQPCTATRPGPRFCNSKWCSTSPRRPCPSSFPNSLSASLYGLGVLWNSFRSLTYRQVDSIVDRGPKAVSLQSWRCPRCAWSVAREAQRRVGGSAGRPS